jgi:hypothetical protein
MKIALNQNNKVKKMSNTSLQLIQIIEEVSLNALPALQQNSKLGFQEVYQYFYRTKQL